MTNYRFVPKKDTTMEEILWLLEEMDLRISKETFKSMPENHKRNWEELKNE